MSQKPQSPGQPSTPSVASPSRRGFLAGAAGATAALGASLLPPSLIEQLAHAAPAGSLSDVKHVIFLMQENRSFDHYFGTLRGVQGFGDPQPLRTRTGGSVFEQPAGLLGNTFPFSIREAAGRQSMNAENVDALNHDWVGGQLALNHGWNDKWILAKTAATMAHYDRQDLPFQYELADAFTICDQYFCSCPTSTSPNRNYFFSGTTGVEPGTPGARAVDNSAYDKDHPGYPWSPVAESLQNAGISWQVYQEWDNFTDNNLEYFRYTKAVSEQVFADFSASGEEYYSALAKATEENNAGEVARLTGLLEAKLAGLSPADRIVFDRALYRSPLGTLTDRVAADIAGGTLPQVSWLVPSAAESEHPSASSPRSAANLIYRLLDALGQNPEVWRSTVVFINFDENDGYFDHVPPPRPPRHYEEEWYLGLPMGLGNRVPMLVISPWTVGGHRCSEVFDHTSPLQFLERWTGLNLPNLSPWRRNICGDLLSAFDFATPAAYVPTAQPRPADPLTPRWNPKPPAQTSLPTPEPGERPQRPLPYQLEVSVTPQPASQSVQVHLRNTGTRAANLLIYPFHSLVGEVTGHDVLGEVTVTIPALGFYDLTVMGPAGFRFDARGPLI